MSVKDDDEYDDDGTASTGDDDVDPFVPLLENDGHRLGRPARRGVGVVGFVPAPTRLSIPELDWLTHVRDGGDRTVRVPDHRYSRSDRNAVEAARGRLYSMVSKQIDQTKRVYKARQRDEEGMLPLGSSSPLDMITRDFNERPLIPWHQTSTGRAGVLTTFVAGSGAQLIPGPPIGVDALSRELFQFDCWGTYDVHMTTSPDLFFSGLRGQGKSYCAKVLAVREIGFGRNVIVQSDRQGEWKAIAQAIPGGQVVSPGKGSYLNPFAMPDSSHLKGDADRRAFRQEVLSGRKSAMMALAEAVKEPDRPFPLDKDMLSLIDQLIASYDVGPMTLQDAVARLSDWDWVDSVYENIHGFEHYRDLAREKASEAARVFSPMVEGGTMSGMFDQGVHNHAGPGRADHRVRHVRPRVPRSHVETRVHGRGQLVDRPAAAGTRRIAPHHRMRGGVGPAVQSPAGRLVADPAAFRGPLGLRDMADRARRRGHDPGVHGRQWPARQGRTAHEPDGNEDHLPAGRREHTPAEPAHP